MEHSVEICCGSVQRCDIALLVSRFMNYHFHRLGNILVYLNLKGVHGCCILL
jgi:hypothetical protein